MRGCANEQDTTIKDWVNSQEVKFTTLLWILENTERFKFKNKASMNSRLNDGLIGRCEITETNFDG